MNRIIIAEDHQTTRECIVYELKTALKSKGIHVNFDQVDNGEDLVERVLKEEYAVGLIDCHMPKKDGLRAIRDIRAFNKDIPLIMISSSDYREQAMNYGAKGYAVKPDAELIPKLVEIIRPYLSQ